MNQPKEILFFGEARPMFVPAAIFAIIGGLMIALAFLLATSMLWFAILIVGIAIAGLLSPIKYYLTRHGLSISLPMLYRTVVANIWSWNQAGEKKLRFEGNTLFVKQGIGTWKLALKESDAKRVKELLSEHAERRTSMRNSIQNL